MPAPFRFSFDDIAMISLMRDADATLSLPPFFFAATLLFRCFRFFACHALLLHMLSLRFRYAAAHDTGARRAADMQAGAAPCHN